MRVLISVINAGRSSSGRSRRSVAARWRTTLAPHRAALLEAGLPSLSPERARALTVPKQLIRGAATSHFQRRVNQRLARLVAEARDIVVEGASHLMHEDNPSAVARAVRQLAASMRAPAASGDRWDGARAGATRPRVPEGMTSSLPRDQALLTQHRILGAMAALMQERGYSATTIDAVAERAAVAAATVYRTFGSKAGWSSACTT